MSPMLRFERRVLGGIQKLLLRRPALRLGVACSGGPDSMALLHILAKLAPSQDWRLTVLHVNHGLRPESDREQALVTETCRNLNLPLRVQRLHPRVRQTGIEAWARNERYAFFAHCRQGCPLDYVVTAHTRDDQAETVLFRILRGSVRRGLAGIPPKRAGWLIRPMLDCTRQEVEAYLRDRQVTYAVDPSNTDVGFARNRIRHQLLPLLEREYSPQIRRHLVSLAETTREEEDWLEELATQARIRLTSPDGSLALAGLEHEPAGLRARILRQWAERTADDVTAVHVRGLCELSRGTRRGRLQLPGKLTVVREAGRLRFESNAAPAAVCEYRHLLGAGQGRTVGAGWHLRLSPPLVWEDGSAAARTDDPWSALFDCAAARHGLVVRNYCTGDRIRPLGMRGHKKVHDVFVDTKLPRPLRRGFPVVELNGELAWVPGCVRGRPALVTADTRRVYRARMDPLPSVRQLW